ncbi:hypothetical protein CHS0354_019644 [Potamilus streckersoni]|uniref:Uncharacterized protein n=1 Tax=Potamilus streckersoni TaxID=2493646 RepID=A0AAE0T8T5_9BIVA|nr:hypothetical protein CHS0354_019644 [Potamilus streckersoni]
MAVEENFLEHVPLSCLSANTIKELGVLLDPAVLESDVRCLADLLDYDYTHVRNLEDRNDRTKYFFDSWWCLRPDFTVLKLKECLEIMEREDIIADIWPKIVNDAQDWKRNEQERPIPDAPTGMADDGWKLTIHDTDQGQPARYNACLCYEEDDIETAERFESELRKIHADLKFFVPHLHVMPGKYIYDCVAQVIDERCNKKVVIILPKKEFTDATCDFALQYARALDPFGVIIPVIRDDTVEVPCILAGVAAIRFHRFVHPKIYKQTADLLKFSNISEKRKPKVSNTFSSSRSYSDTIYVDKRKYSILQRIRKRLKDLFSKSSGSQTRNIIEMRSRNSSTCSIEESPSSQENEEFLYGSNEESGDSESDRQRSKSLNDLHDSRGTSRLSYSSVIINADVHINDREGDSVITESTERSSNISISEEKCSISNTNMESHRVSSDSGTS